MLTINRKVWYWRSSYTSDTSLIICLFQSECLSLLNPSVHIFTHLSHTPLQVHILSSPIPSPNHPTYTKDHYLASKVLQETWQWLTLFTHLPCEVINMPFLLSISSSIHSHSPMYLNLHSFFRVHWCPIFLMKFPRLPCLLIFHCTGFPTHSVSIQLPSHAIHHLS